MQKTYTIGYEGSVVSDFLETLKVVGVQTLVDVRALPLSRKPGFSKSKLSALISDAGLEYCHMASLGDPKPGRDAARAGDFGVFRKIFREHLKKPESQAAMQDLHLLAKRKIICLLCFERDYKCCHRSMIADALRKMGECDIRHIGVRCGRDTARRVTGVAVHGDSHARRI